MAVMSETITAKPVPCNCWHATDNELRKKGLKISDKCSLFQVTKSLGLAAVYGLPLARLDGKRFQKGEPTLIKITHCPFCGREMDSQ